MRKAGRARILPIISIALALIMTSSLVPAAAFAGPSPAAPAGGAGHTLRVDRLGPFALDISVAAEQATLNLDITSGFSPAIMAQVLADEQNRNPRLSDTIRQDFEQNPTGMLGIDPNRWADFQGQLSPTTTGIRLVVSSDVPTTNANWWQTIVASSVGVMVGLGLRVLCVGAFPAAALACAAMGAGLGGLTRGVILQYFDGTLRDAQAWANTLIAAFFMACGAALWESGINVWSREQLPGILRGIAAALRRMIASAWAWFVDVLQWAADGLQSMADYIPAAVARLRRGTVTLMPLGDSITLGVGSSTGSSYRGYLQHALWDQRIAYDFLGSQRSGTMPAEPSPPYGDSPAYDPDHEGHSGWRIDEIGAQAPCWVAGAQPNIVTLHLGTNDMIQNFQAATAPNRLGAVIDQIFQALPGTAIVVSTLVPSRTPAINARIGEFNRQLPGMVRARQAAGQHVLLVDMGAVNTADIADDVHPNDRGYLKMAKLFNLGIIEAGNRGWLIRPTGVPCGGPPIGNGRQVQFADLNADGFADYLAVDPRDGSVHAWVNDGADFSGDHWLDRGIIASGTNTGVGVGARQVQFADLSGDRRADYLAVDPRDGSVHAWVNDGADFSGDHWLDRGIIASGTNTGVGVGARQVQFADLSGDRRADYLAVDPRNGSVHGWMNDGADFSGDHWLDRGIIASGTNTGVATGGRQVQFVQLSNDGRADYLAVDPRDGSVHGWVNDGADFSGDHWLDRGIIASGTNTGVG